MFKQIIIKRTLFRGFFFFERGWGWGVWNLNPAKGEGWLYVKYHIL
jgi:hypothetical protein